MRDVGEMKCWGLDETRKNDAANNPALFDYRRRESIQVRFRLNITTRVTQTN